MASIIEDLEDNYPDYLDDALGYRWDAWDVLTLGQIDRHDAILESTTEDRNELDLGLADDLLRWAYCRSAARDDDRGAFLESARLILSGDQTNAELLYNEIASVTILMLSDAELFDEARLILADWKEKLGEIESGRLGAHLHYQENSNDVSKFEALRDPYSEDLEFMFDLAEDLIVLNELDAAKKFVEVIENNSTIENAIWVDLQSLKRRLM